LSDLLDLSHYLARLVQSAGYSSIFFFPDEMSIWSLDGQNCGQSATAAYRTEVFILPHQAKFLVVWTSAAHSEPDWSPPPVTFAKGGKVAVEGTVGVDPNAKIGVTAPLSLPAVDNQPTKTDDGELIKREDSFFAG
jgi:hypothetical protein